MKDFNEPSKRWYIQQGNHIDDVELLKNLMGLALENANNFSEDVVENKNDCNEEEKNVEENCNPESEDKIPVQGETSKNGKTRGLTKLLNIFQTSKLMIVHFNEHGQPESSALAKLGSFLGLIARNGQVTPLNFSDWRSMSHDFKDLQWHVVTVI